MIRLYIVTYKRNDVLNRNLRSLWASLSDDQAVQVTVLANHPGVAIEPENERACLSVTINTTRSPNAWGYLARDWNFGLLDAFRDSGNPNGTEWAVLAQNDVVWVPGWDAALRKEKRYDFISQPSGDQMMAFRVEAVRAIGFFDERFCTLHFQEVDYFYRAVLQHGARVSINDDHYLPKSQWQSLELPLIEPASSGVMEDDNLHTNRFNQELYYWLLNKWAIEGGNIHDLHSHHDRFRGSDQKLPEEINWYPFFWVGDAPCVRNFLHEYKAEPLSWRRVFRAVRDTLPTPIKNLLQTALHRARRR